MTTAKNAALRVLIINPFGIGDCLFTTPLLRALKLDYPESFIGYWCNLRVSPLIRQNPKINRVFIFSRGDLKKIYEESVFAGIREFLKLFLALRKEKFDICFDFSLDHRYGLIAKFAGIKKRFGFDYKGRGRFLTQSIPISEYSGKHVIDYYSGLGSMMGVDVKDMQIDVPVSRENKDRAGKMLLARGVKEGDLVIAVCPASGASWGKDAQSRHWEALKFASLCDRMAKELKAKVVIIADESERQIAETVVNACRIKPVDLTGKLSLEALPAVINCARIFVSVDGGPMHIAVGLKLKTVTIMGPVDEKVYGPYPPTGNNIILTRATGCRPCYRNFRLPLCVNNRKCLSEIGVDEVMDAVRRLL